MAAVERAKGQKFFAMDLGFCVYWIVVGEKKRWTFDVQSFAEVLG